MSNRPMVAVVTGGACGIGRMCALALAGSGCDIAVSYRESEDAALDLREQIQSRQRRCRAIRADIERTDDLRRLIESAGEELGGVDILINGVGPFIHEMRPFSDYSDDEIESLVRSNLISAMHLTRLVLPWMHGAGWGRIIHFGFGRAAEAPGWPYRAVYAAAKVGLVSFTKTLAAEEAARRVTVNMVCPGDIRGSYKEKTADEVRDESDPELPGMRPGTGEDVARVVAFLCSPAADYITGSIIDVTGGLDPIARPPAGGAPPPA
jgi:3-oxoacyl-[acyl-carrier protein] reductase